MKMRYYDDIDNKQDLDRLTSELAKPDSGWGDVGTEVQNSYLHHLQENIAEKVLQSSWEKVNPAPEKKKRARKPRSTPEDDGTKSA